VRTAGQVKDKPKRRRYDTSRRQAAALQTRRAIAAAALELFLERGYGATTMAAIAQAAGISHETETTRLVRPPAPPRQSCAPC
jgi:aspartate aminotransferase-like enzyme